MAKALTIWKLYLWIQEKGIEIEKIHRLVSLKKHRLVSLFSVIAVQSKENNATFSLWHHTTRKHRSSSSCQQARALSLHEGIQEENRPRRNQSS